MASHADVIVFRAQSMNDAQQRNKTIILATATPLNCGG